MFSTFRLFSPADRNARPMRFVLQYAQFPLVQHDVPAWPWYRSPGSQVCCSTLVIHFQIFGEIFGSNAACEHCLLSQGPIVGHHYRRPWHVHRLTFSLGICLVCVSFNLAVPSTSIPLGSHSPPLQKIWDTSLQGNSTKRGTVSPSIFGQ